MSKKTLNAINLETLGAEKLAALLMEVSTGSADIKRRLRLELSHNLGVSELAHEVRKRLASLRKSTSYIGWRKRKSLIKDLHTQVTMIVDKIAAEDPITAFDLLWQFIEMAPQIYARVDDSKGDVSDVFRDALQKFSDIAPRAELDPDALADRVREVVLDNAYGEWDGVITVLAPALGASGLAALKVHIEAYAGESEEGTTSDHDAIEFLRQLRGGTDYVAKRKARFVQSCLQEIAEAAGDTASYIAQFSATDLERKDIAAEVAMLLLANDQGEDALDALLAAEPTSDSHGQEAWDDAYIAVLIALGHTEDAQTHRWNCFSETLNAQRLRDYLNLLPDFDDVEAEDTAKRHVLSFHDVSTALGFCLQWPDLLTAARLVEARAEELNGSHDALLTSAAEALRQRHPLAATLIFRSMINDALQHGRATKYGQAADHLSDCASLDVEIEDYKTVPSHAQYIEALEARHDPKSSFWAKVRAISQ